LAGSFYLEDMWDFMILVEIYVLLDDASGFWSKVIFLHV
jgi:hypothetical protein